MHAYLYIYIMYNISPVEYKVKHLHSGIFVFILGCKVT